MADNNTFVVVETIHKGDRETFTVPDFWIVDGFVFYPPGKDESKKVRSRASLNDRWPKYPCTILRDDIRKQENTSYHTHTNI